MRPFSSHAPTTENFRQMSPAERLAHAFFSRRSHTVSTASGLPGAAARPSLSARQSLKPNLPQFRVSNPVVTSAKIRSALATANDWSASGAPRPVLPPDPQVVVSQISCPVANVCFAVGAYANSVSANPGLLLRLSGGIWTAKAAPLPAGAATNGFVDLNGIECVSATQCTAVGDYSDTAGTEYYGGADTQPLVETLQSGVWTPVKASVPANSDFMPHATLTSVACPTTTSCTAVGIYAVSGQPVSFIATEASGVWMSQAAPTPPAGGGFVSYGEYFGLVRIVCESAGDCAAVGLYEGQSGGRAMFDQEVNGVWKAVSVPKASSSFLDSVACPTASTCVAVGGIGSRFSGKQTGYAVSEESGKLTAVQTPLPKDAPAKKVLEVDLNSVACSSSSCVAVGDWITGTTTVQGNFTETTLGQGYPGNQ